MTVSTTDAHSLIRLTRFLWPKNRLDLRIRIVIALIFLAASKVLSVCIPFFYKAAIDQLSVKTAVIAVPAMLIIAYSGNRILSHALGELRDAVFAKALFHAIRSVAKETFEHLHNLSLRFHLNRKTGGVSRAIERGSQGIQFLLSFMLFNILPTFLEITLVCGILLVKYDWTFAVITFFTIVGYIAFTLTVTEWRTQFRRKMNEADTQANSKAIDSLLNYETVKYFGNESLELERYDSSLAHYEKEAVKNQTSLSYLNIGQASIISLGLAAVMFLAAKGVAAHQLSVGDFVLVNTFLIQLYLPLNFLGFVYRQMKQSLVDIENMFALLSENKEIVDHPDARPLTATQGELQFKRVRFGYDTDRVILHDVSFTVPAGKTVAIVGASGAGKSTISRLLFRFYDISDGEIMIDGQDIRTVTQHSLRHAIGIVPQDTVLFNDTIYYNIWYGDPTATREEILTAAKMAQIHDFIQTLPKGYDTMVGERGLKLSGGEKQRVAIARMILKSPAILVFDEATSALDTQTEKEIQSALSSVSQNKTTIIIAHRLSTVINADQIIVLQNGRIKEKGTHLQLLSHQQGLYAALWMQQQQESQENAEIS